MERNDEPDRGRDHGGAAKLEPAALGAPGTRAVQSYGEHAGRAVLEHGGSDAAGHHEWVSAADLLAPEL